MGLETATYINGLVTTNPTSSDPKSQGDDHLRLVKSTVKATFPNITGAVTPTQADLNVLAGAAAGSVNLTVASLTDSGNLNFTGTGNRITGDFSNATVANRVIFQSSTTNGATDLIAIPNGTGTRTGFIAYGGTDPVNSNNFQLTNLSGTDARLTAGALGTGTLLPMTFYTGGSERVRVDTSGNVGIGTNTPGSTIDVRTSAATIGNFKSSATNGGYIALDNGSALTYIGSRKAILASGNPTDFAIIGTGANTLALGTASVERMLIDSIGNVTVSTAALLGYGTGSGGTVTQATSKSTAVTLNKPTGKITMNNAALASGASVTFQFNNSLISANDTVICSIDANSMLTAHGVYSLDLEAATGSAFIAVKNNYPSSLSEAVVINFAVIKGSAT